MSAPAIYPDPRGELDLRREIAAYLALARGIACTPSQIIITSGFSGGLGLALRVLGLESKTKVWMENPGFPFTRHGLALARLSIAPIPVDADGIDVDYGLKHAPDAALVVVTPGQQAPLGSTLSLARRSRLLDWAARRKAWVIEDDYLSELQLKGRATPALASLDRAGRVIHIGSFSKTVTPALRLGFVVAPAALASRFAEAAACLAPAPGPAVQLRDRRFHARRPLSAASPAHEAGLRRARRCIAETASDAHRQRCACRIGSGPAAAGWSARSRHRQGKQHRSDWRLLRCRCGMRPRLRRAPVCCWVSPHLRKSGSRLPATGSLKSSIV